MQTLKNILKKKEATQPEEVPDDTSRAAGAGSDDASDCDDGGVEAAAEMHNTNVCVQIYIE